MKKRALSIGFALWSGCFFMPNVDESGYTDCDTANDCDVGRYCASNYCVPPPWHDESYNQRRLLVLENQREAKLYKGNAISFWVGESGTTLSLEDVTSDTRYLYFDIEAQRWDILPVYFDVFDDRYAVWLPISEDVAAGGRAPLVWMENLAGDSDKGPNVNPSQVFAMYYNFGVTESCQSPWLCFGTGTPVLTEGVVRVEDNQMMLLDQPLTLPFDISFKLRINGANCENVFWGLKASRNQSFEPPMLGFGVSDERQLRFEHYPQGDSLSPEISELEEIDTALHTYRIHAGASDIRLYRDQTLLATLGLNTALDETAEYFPYLDVDGACSAEIRNLWASPTPAGTTQITAEDAVQFQLF